MDVVIVGAGIGGLTLGLRLLMSLTVAAQLKANPLIL